ncbi:complement C2-like [Acanthaster planci]|uniref:C3/C5 convertase n=1 Tax=Acanthaster planci TaxID=133434 RepID=A0A8B7Z0N9_ACAPL|nr:complement C2-like [Acanthaster planci]
MVNPAAKIVVCLAILLLAVVSISAGEGCPEPPPVAGGTYEFGAYARPGADGRYPEQSLVVVVCLKGYQLQGGDSIISCNENGEWSASPKCQVRGCLRPAKPWNGKAVRFKGGRRVGGQAVFKCKPGFDRVGPARKTCTVTPRGVEWTGPGGITECVARNSCRSPGVLHGANWTLIESDRRSHHEDPTFSPNTKINVECWPGFVSTEGPSVQIACGMSGEWSPPIPTCREVICPSLLESEADIDHLHSTMENRTYILGEVVNYHCDAGYRILGKTRRQCSGPNLYSPNRTWTDLDPICSEIECPDPGRIQFGGSRYLGSTRIGGSVTFRCRSGYRLQGSAVRHCLPNGRWNGTLTTCDHENFYCPNPGIPIGGRMVNQHRVRFRKGERVSYECSRDKVLIGSEERECLKSRSWSGEPPTCEGPYDFEDASEVAARLGYTLDGLPTDPQDSVSETPGPRGRFIDLGYTGGMDIYFVFDVSGSVRNSMDGLTSSINLAKALVKKIGGLDGPRRARYGACVYATNALSLFGVSDSQSSVNTLLENMIKNPQHIRDLGTGTATGKALQLVHEFMIPSAGENIQESKKYLFLFTDGKTNMGANVARPKTEAKTLRKRYDVKIHCIGVGDEVDKSELRDIASKPVSDHLFVVENANDVYEVAQNLLEQKIDYSRCGLNRPPKTRATGRIVGGDNAQQGMWPWQVALFCQKTSGCESSKCPPLFYCGGSLIAPNWVLTAAHCLRKCQAPKVRIYTGILDIYAESLRQFDQAQVYTIDAQIHHENFSQVTFDHDIALLRLSKNATLSPNVRPICLPQPTMQDDAIYSTDGKSYVTGWGHTEAFDVSVDEGRCRNPKGITSTRFLQQLAIPLRTNEECSQSFSSGRYECRFTSDYKPNMAFCAGYPDGNQDACNGDSGGPVMREVDVGGSLRWVQIGIVSWGEGCAVEGRYGVYTRVSAYKDWIEEHIRPAAFAISH